MFLVRVISLLKMVNKYSCMFVLNAGRYKENFIRTMVKRLGTVKEEI